MALAYDTRAWVMVSSCSSRKNGSHWTCRKRSRRSSDRKELVGVNDLFCCFSTLFYAPKPLTDVFNAFRAALYAPRKKCFVSFFALEDDKRKICFRFVSRISNGISRQSAKFCYLCGWCYCSRIDNRIRFRRTDSNPLFDCATCPCLFVSYGTVRVQEVFGLLHASRT